MFRQQSIIDQQDIGGRGLGKRARDVSVRPQGAAVKSASMEIEDRAPTNRMVQSCRPYQVGLNAVGIDMTDLDARRIRRGCHSFSKAARRFRRF